MNSFPPLTVPLHLLLWWFFSYSIHSTEWKHKNTLISLHQRSADAQPEHRSLLWSAAARSGTTTALSVHPPLLLLSFSLENNKKNDFFLEKQEAGCAWSTHLKGGQFVCPKIIPLFRIYESHGFIKSVMTAQERLAGREKADKPITIDQQGRLQPSVKKRTGLNRLQMWSFDWSCNLLPWQAEFWLSYWSL